MKMLLATAILAGSAALALPASAQVASAALNPTPSLGNTPEAAKATTLTSDAGYTITLGTPDARGATPVIRTPVTPAATPMTLPPPFNPTSNSTASPPFPVQPVAVTAQAPPKEAPSEIPPLKVSGARRAAADSGSDDELAGAPK